MQKEIAMRTNTQLKIFAAGVLIALATFTNMTNCSCMTVEDRPLHSKF
jgi:hypothetical protein